jgi:hypothetical protein
MRLNPKVEQGLVKAALQVMTAVTVFILIFILTIFTLA